MIIEVSRIKFGITFLTPGAKLAFAKLRQAFNTAQILQHFHPQCDIQIEMDVLGYTISQILSQLTFENLGQWHPMSFLSQKMIPIEIQHKTRNHKFLIIVKMYKSWPHYLNDYEYKVLILTHHNNVYYFMMTKNLSSKQICWAQILLS